MNLYWRQWNDEEIRSMHGCEDGHEDDPELHEDEAVAELPNIVDPFDIDGLTWRDFL